MLVALPAIAAFLLALLCGGSAHNLGTVRLKGAPLVVVAFALEVVITLPTIRTLPFVLQWSNAAYSLMMILLLCAVLRNWQLGLPLYGLALGLALNTFVIVLNNGEMPVSARVARVYNATMLHKVKDHRVYSNVRSATSATRLSFLGDIYPLPFPLGLGNVYSIGDILLTASGAVLVFKLTRWPQRMNESEHPLPLAS